MSRMKKVGGVCVCLILLSTTFIFVGCGAYDTPDTHIPVYVFDYPLELDNREVAHCYSGVIEDGMNDLSYWEQKLLNQFSAALSGNDLHAQSKAWHSEVMQGFSEVSSKDSRRLQSIMDKQIAVLDAHGIEHPDFSCFLVETQNGQSVVNAWTTGSYIYFSVDMLRICETDDQLSYVMAHELMHTVLGHTGHFSQRKSLLVNKLGEKWGEKIAEFYEEYIASGLSKSDELECDLSALILMYESGFDPAEAIIPLQKFSEMSDMEDYAIQRLVSSHPISEIRVNCVAGALERARIAGKQQTLISKNK